MSNDLMTHNDDGFGEFRTSRRTKHWAKWDDVNSWRDNDGLPLPEVLVLLGICEFHRRWTKDGDKNIPTDITERPLPDLDGLNASIPEKEWPIGRDGNKEKPFKHYVGFTLVNPATGTLYFYSNSTWGAHELYDTMDEEVTTMRAMRGTRCVPVVKLSQRPKPSKKFGKVMHPHFEILDWKTMGDGGNAIPPQTSTPQLTGPPAASTPAARAPAAAVPESRPHPAQAPTTKPASPKTPVKLSEYTLGVMGTPKPVTTAERLNDSLDDLPWDIDAV